MELNSNPVKKLFYKISEVAKMFDVNISTVRYWEKEFEILKPKKNKKGNRLFTPKDLTNIKIIHHRLLNYIHYSGRYYYLTWQPRKLLKKQLQDYDIFIYSEDDILIPERAFNYWLRNKNSLIKNDANVGFLRVESKDGEDFLSDITSSFSSKSSILSQLIE